MAVVQMLACDGCGVYSGQSNVQKVSITLGGKRVTVDACQDCIDPVFKLIDGHSKGKKTGRVSGLNRSQIVSDPSLIVKDNPRPRKASKNKS